MSTKVTLYEITGSSNSVKVRIALGYKGLEYDRQVVDPQISGTTFENMALAEVVLLDLADYAVTFDLAGAATETLEVLDVPIGEGRTSRAESLDILRAQAGQQALDRSLNILRKRCHGVREKTAFMDVTGNFQTGDPAQNPALST